MKTERRHDLQTNELAKELARWIERIKPYSKAVGGVIIAAAVIVAVAAFLTTRTSKTEAAAWDAYFEATSGGSQNLDALEAVAVEYGGTSVEHWAVLAQADAQLQIGSRMLFHDKKEAKRYLDDAADAYVKLAAVNNQVLIVERATFGLARAYEALGDLKAAGEQYLNVKGAFREMAEQRAEVLERDDVKDFYDWFAVAEPPQQLLPNEPGVPGLKPEFSVDGLEDYTGQGTPSMDPADGGEQNGGQSSLLETDATDVPGDSHPAESDLAPLGTDDE